MMAAGLRRGLARNARRPLTPFAHCWIPEQKISVDEAVHAYTVGSSYAEFQDSVKGSIAPGKLADLVLLSRDIFQIDPKEIENVKVLMTIVDGRIVYETRISLGR